MVTLETILDLLPIPTMGILIALVYYIISIRTQTKTRQAQLYMQFLTPILSGEKSKAWHKLQRWEWGDYDNFMQNYWSKAEKRETWSSLSGYFEGLGVYIERGSCPSDSWP